MRSTSMIQSGLVFSPALPPRSNLPPPSVTHGTFPLLNSHSSFPRHQGLHRTYCNIHIKKFYFLPSLYFKTLLNLRGLCPVLAGMTSLLFSHNCSLVPSHSYDLCGSDFSSQRVPTRPRPPYASFRPVRYHTPIHVTPAHAFPSPVSFYLPTSLYLSFPSLPARFLRHLLPHLASRTTSPFASNSH